MYNGGINPKDIYIDFFTTPTSTVITCHAKVLNKVNYAFPLLKQNKLAIFGMGYQCYVGSVYDEPAYRVQL